MGGRRSGKEGRCGGEKLEEYFGNLQENLSGFERQAGKCKQKGLKPAYNPAVCTEGDTYELSANCKYVDKKNNCKEFYGKIQIHKIEKIADDFYLPLKGYASDP